MSVLKKTLIAGLAALTLTAGVVTASAPAAAWYRGYGWGAPVAAGVIGGLAAGAIIGSASRPYGYYGYPAYDEGGCYFVRRRTFDAYGNFIGYHRTRVCE
jgi:hypothetical protein